MSSAPASHAELYIRARAKVPVKVRLLDGEIRRRSPMLTVGLVLATFGIYGIFWLYALSRELKRTTLHAEMRPTRDLVLMLVTLGLYGIVVLHRHARMIHGVSVYFDRSHDDRSAEALTFALGGLLSAGLLGLFAVHLLQRQMNELGDLVAAQARIRARRDERSSARLVTTEG